MTCSARRALDWLISGSPPHCSANSARSMTKSSQPFSCVDAEVRAIIDSSNDGDNKDDQQSEHVVVDNPDQRITEDVQAFTGFSLKLFLAVLMSVVDLVCFSVILYTIMPELFLVRSAKG